MKQEFTYHTLNMAQAPVRASRFADAVTEYFAYVALLAVAVAVAVVTMAFSANVAVRVLDKVAKPGFFDAETQSLPASDTKTPETVAPFKRDTFAMMPASMPAREERRHLVQLLADDF